MRSPAPLCFRLLLFACGLAVGGTGIAQTAPAAKSATAAPVAPVAPAAIRAADPAGERVSTPAFNWVLPLFTDKEGFRSMTLRGSEVRPIGRDIAVTDLSITTFSGDAAARVDSILLSPAAIFYPKENRAGGEKSVRFIRGDIEINGSDWTYDHAAKKLSLRRAVRVTFQAQLNDILK